MAEQIKVGIGLDDKLSPETKRAVQKTNAELGKVAAKAQAVSGVMKAAFAGFSIAAVVKGISSSLKAYDQQAKAVASLDQQLGRNTKSLQKYASQLQSVTLYGDEVTISAMASLGAFVQNEDQIKKLMPLIQDYATANKMDLVQATQLVGKSLGSSTNALSRYGIEITGAVGSSERFESALKGLGKWQGQAEAAANSGTGAITQMKNAFGDIVEMIGGEFAPVFVGIAKNINENMPTIANVAQKAAMIIVNSFRVVQFLFHQVTAGIMTLGQGFGKVMAFITRKESWNVFANEMGKAADEAADKAVAALEKVSMKTEEIRGKVAGFTPGASFTPDISGGGGGGETEKKVVGKTAAEKELEKTIESRKELTLEYAMWGKSQREKELIELDQWYSEKAELIMSAFDNEAEITQKTLALYGEYNNKKTDIDKRYAENKERLDTRSGNITLGMIGAISNAYGVMSQDMRKAAIADKVTKAAMAAINTALAITNQLAQGEGYSAPARAIAVGLQGAAEVAAILATPLAKGADFTTNGKQLLLVGDNPGGRERVQVTPESSNNLNGPQGETVFNFNVNGNMTEEVAINTVKMFREAMKEAKYMGQI